MAEIYQLPESGSTGSLPFSIPLNGFGNGNGFGMNGIADLFGLAIIASIFGWNGNGFGGGMGGNGAGFISNQLNNDHGRVIGKWVDGDDAKYAEFCYDLTISQLTDADRPKFVRGYFGLD